MRVSDEQLIRKFVNISTSEAGGVIHGSATLCEDDRVCPVCGKHLVKEGKRCQSLHMLYHGKPAVIDISRQKYRCYNHDKDKVFWAGDSLLFPYERMTADFFHYVIREWLDNPQVNFSQLAQCYHVNRNTIADYVNKLLSHFEQVVESAAPELVLLGKFEYDKLTRCFVCGCDGHDVDLYGFVDEYTPSKIKEYLNLRLKDLSNTKLALIDLTREIPSKILKTHKDFSPSFICDRETLYLDLDDACKTSYRPPNKEFFDYITSEGYGIFVQQKYSSNILAQLRLGIRDMMDEACKYHFDTINSIIAMASDNIEYIVNSYKFFSENRETKVLSQSKKYDILKSINSHKANRELYLTAAAATNYFYNIELRKKIQEQLYYESYKTMFLRTVYDNEQFKEAYHKYFGEEISRENQPQFVAMEGKKMEYTMPAERFVENINKDLKDYSFLLFEKEN